MLSNLEVTFLPAVAPVALAVPTDHRCSQAAPEAASHMSSAERMRWPRDGHHVRAPRGWMRRVSRRETSKHFPGGNQDLSYFSDLDVHCFPTQSFSESKVTPSTASTSQSSSCFLAFACVLPVPYIWTIPLFCLILVHFSSSRSACISRTKASPDL